MSNLTSNQRDILDRAVASAANSATNTSWILDGEEAQALLDQGYLSCLEGSRYGNLLRVRPTEKAGELYGRN